MTPKKNKKIAILIPLLTSTYTTILPAFQNKQSKCLQMMQKWRVKGDPSTFHRESEVFSLNDFPLKCKDSLQQSSNLLTNLNFHMKEYIRKQKKPYLRNLTIL